MIFHKIKQQLRSSYWLLLPVFFLNCSSSSGEGGDVANELSDLVVNVEVVGATSASPNGDGSGTINLSFSAENATSYKVNFGNGEVKETTGNSLSYTYVGQGTNTYQIHISAYRAEKFISVSESVTIYVDPALVFADEFNGEGSPDNSKWVFEIGNSGWGNNEVQYYTNRTENAKMEDGVLKITAQKENYEGAPYTSARLKTQGKFEFTYGKVEVRAKLPNGGGTWPAIWMLGSNINTVGWPAGGEIDIMEHVGNNPGHVISAIHTPSSHGNTQNVTTKEVPDATSEFHVYGLEWDETKLQISIDGVVHYTYNPATKNENTWPFNKNQFLLLNIAVGGTLGGDIDPEFTSGTMEIDYVRVYK